MSSMDSRIRAPVALFVYARPDHTRRTIESLAAANGANETDVVVFADGARDSLDEDRVEATRNTVRCATGFRSLNLIERDRNFGLAENITNAVTDMFTEHSRLIVLEDDIVVARGFLDYLNAALDRYENESEVWHISGWNYPIDTAGLDPYFFWPTMNCWGWATWADRWAQFRVEPECLLAAWSPEKRRAFNLDGAYDFFGQVEDNAAGRIRTWAIFWYATIFEQGGLCLNPTHSFVQNIGFDGSGEHCGSAVQTYFEDSLTFNENLPTEIAINTFAVDRIRAYLSPTLFQRVYDRSLRFLRRHQRV